MFVNLSLPSPYAPRQRQPYVMTPDIFYTLHSSSPAQVHYKYSNFKIYLNIYPSFIDDIT